MLALIQRRAASGSTRLGISPLGNVTVTNMPVPAKARKMSGFTSKILIRSMMVLSLRRRRDKATGVRRQLRWSCHSLRLHGDAEAEGGSNASDTMLKYMKGMKDIYY